MSLIIADGLPFVQKTPQEPKARLFRPPKLMPSEQLLPLKSLSNEQLLLIYAVVQGLREARPLSQMIRKHRSTTLKYLENLVELEIIQVSTKPGTEKKVKPTKLYSLSPGIPIGRVRQIASSRGFDLDNLYQQRVQPDPKVAEAKVTDQPDPPPVDQPIEHKVSEEEIMPTSFELQIQELLQQLVNDVADIKKRVSALETANQERPRPAFRLGELLSQLREVDENAKNPKKIEDKE